MGYVVLTNGISVDLSKVKVVLNWQRPKIGKELQSFLGLVGYCKQFLKGFVKLAKLLMKLTRDIIPFGCFDACERSFQELKQMLTSIPVSAQPTKGEKFDLYADASHEGLGAILMQKGRLIANVFQQFEYEN